MPQFLVRWFDEANAECLRSDGVWHESAGDFAYLSNVFVTTSVHDAQRIIEEALVNDELVDTRDGEDNEIPIESGEFTWDDEHSPQYACEFRGDIVAIAIIEPVVVLEAPGGPT